jgi:hypothetical protein
MAGTGTYNHTLWMQDTTGLARTLGDIESLLQAAEPYLKAVQAGKTQMEGNRRLAELCGQLRRRGEVVAGTWDAAYQDLNRAVTGTHGDRAEDKRYAR